MESKPFWAHRYDIMVWKMGQNTFASWSINVYLCEQCLFQTPRYRNWGKCGGLCIIYYSTYVVPNNKTIFFVEHRKYRHQYMLQPTPFSVIRAIASIQLHSHSLVWDKGNYACFATSSIVQAWNFDIIFAFDHIQLCFPYLSRKNNSERLIKRIDLTQYFHEFLSQSQCALSIMISTSKVPKHWKLLFTATRVTCFFLSHRSY